MRTMLCLLLPVCLSLSVSAGEEDPVQFEKQGDQIQITLNGEKFATYNTSGEYKKPFLLPVYGPGGIKMTRDLNDPADKDHPHHKGVWVSIDEVNKIRFWAEESLIVNKSVETAASKGYGTLTVVNHWQDTQGQPVVEEKTVITFYPDYLLTYDITFTAVSEEVVFEDTKEGLFGYRMPSTMKETNGGKIVTSAGVEGTKDAWGKPAEWIDYYGTVEGKTMGATIMDHPANFRPSRYHVRNYGLFSINPFGQKAYSGGKEEAQPMHMKKGDSFRLRYGLYLHAGSTQEAKVAEKYREFVQRAQGGRQAGN